MLVQINGKVYDSEKVPIVIKLNIAEQGLISSMGDSKYFMSFPEEFDTKVAKKILDDFKKRTEKKNKL